MRLKLHALYVGTIESKIYMYMLHRHGYRLEEITFIRYNNYDSFIEKREKFDARLAQHILDLHGIDLETLKTFSIQSLSDKTSTVLVNSLQDDNLKTHLQQASLRNFLYTGGGKLPHSLLSLPNAKFIHIHPGILPDIKGADCFLWSFALTNKLGYSCFLLDDGIDTGDILYTRTFPLPKLSFLKHHCDNLETLYKGILHYYDPVLRIRTFIEMLQNHHNTIDTLVATPQNPHQGRTYFFLHKRLKQCILQKLFGSVHD